MARYVDRTWAPTAGSWYARGKEPAEPRPYRAYVPDNLGDIRVTLPGPMATDVVDLEHTLAALARRVDEDPNLKVAPNVLIRLEAIASSRMESVEVSVADFAAYEAKLRAGRRVDAPLAAEVGSNVAAIEAALHTVADTAVNEPVSLTREWLLEVHRTLMAGSRHPALGGVVRETQNWIGGPWSTPLTARFVPPPPEHVDGLLEDLTSFWSTALLPPVVMAALGHAQFLTVHPFGDGNGRAGRAYVHAVHASWGLATTPVPVSVVLASRKQSYVDGLSAFRYEGEPGRPAVEAGVRRWLETYLAAMLRAAYDATVLCQTISETVDTWRTVAGTRRGSAADRILPHLFAMPVLSVGDLTRVLGVSRQAATTAVAQLVDVGVLVQRGTGQRHRWFEAADALEILSEYAKGPRRLY